MSAQSILRAALLAVSLVVIMDVTMDAAVDARPYAWLGVRIRDLSEQEMDDLATRHGIREGFGVVIVEVIEGAPAAKAGVKNGDIIVAVGDRPVVDTRALQRFVMAVGPESDVRVTVLRADGRKQLPVHLAVMPPPVAGERVAAEFGFAIRDPERADREPTGLPRSPAATVAAVMRGSPAERSGLEVGDLIVAVGERSAPTREAAREALADAAPEQPLRLTIRRGERELSLTLSVP